MKKHLKISLILILMAFASIVVCPIHIKAADKTISFNDKNMYDAMKSQLKEKLMATDDNNQSITMTDEAIENTKSLYLSKKSITDLSGIESFINLESLDIQGNEITSIEKVPGEKISSLYVSNIENIKDINLIENYKNLYRIDVDGSSLKEIPESMKKISNQLTYIGWKNGVLESTTWVKDFPKIRSLDLENNSINNLENLSTLTELTSLYLSGNRIENIDEIGKCVSLNILELKDNCVTSLDGISGLSLICFDAANNRITDINALNVGRISRLDLSNNCISDFDIIKDVAVDKKYEISGQLIKIDVNSGDKADIPAMIDQSKNFFNANDIEMLNCTINGSKCEIDESVTYARIKVNDGILKDSMVYFNVTNVQAPGVTEKTINFTKTQLIVICEVIFIMIISVFIIANIKKKKN